ncbi:MAG: PEGA domain-containing protein [Myxococcota bacterium]
MLNALASAKRPHCVIFVHLGLCLGLSLTVHSAPVKAKSQMGFFFHVTRGAGWTRSLAADLNRRVPEVFAETLRKRGITLVDRGLFFSRAEHLAAKNWLKRARLSLDEGLEQIKQNEDPVESLQRASRFFEFAHAYFPVYPVLQKTNLHLGIALWKRALFVEAQTFLRHAILMAPQRDLGLSLRGAAKSLLNAVRCVLSQQKLSVVELRTRVRGASCWLNGRWVGSGRVVRLSLLPGTYLLRVRRDGYRRTKRVLHVRSGQNLAVDLRLRRGPRFQFFQARCQRLLRTRSMESVRDQLRFIREEVMGRSETGRAQQGVFVGCLVKKRGRLLRLYWFWYARRLRRGVLRLSAREIQKKIFSAVARVLKWPVPSSFSPPPVIFPRLLRQARCVSPKSIVFAKERRRARARARAAQLWKVLPGDYISIAMRYGFFLQGKVEAIQGKKLILSASDVDSSKHLSVFRQDVRWVFILGPKQQGGYRLGERLMVLTKMGIRLFGVLTSDDGHQLWLRTKLGTESIRWSWVAKVYRLGS